MNNPNDLTSPTNLITNPANSWYSGNVFYEMTHGKDGLGNMNYNGSWDGIYMGCGIILICCILIAIVKIKLS